MSLCLLETKIDDREDKEDTSCDQEDRPTSENTSSSRGNIN